MQIVLYIALFQTLVTLYFVIIGNPGGVFGKLLKWLVLVLLVQIIAEIALLESMAGPVYSYELMFPTDILIPVFILLLYLYADPGRRWNWKSAIHFTPFLVFLVFSCWAVARYWQTADAGSIRTYSSIYFPVLLTIGAGYCIYIIIHSFRSPDGGGLLHQLNVKLARDISALTLLAVLIVAVMYMLEELGPMNIAGYLYMTFLFLLMLHYIYQAHLLRKGEDKQAGEKYSRSTLSQSEMEDVIERLDNYLAKSELYLSPDVSLGQLSEKSEIPKHHVTQSLSLVRGVNYNHYINDFRVEEFLNRIKKAPDSNIFVLARQCGFSSKSTFNRAFKRKTGQTPSQYVMGRK